MNGKRIDAIKNELQTKKGVRVPFESYKGTARKFYNEMQDAGLKPVEFNENGHFIVRR